MLIISSLQLYVFSAVSKMGLEATIGEYIKIIFCLAFCEIFIYDPLVFFYLFIYFNFIFSLRGGSLESNSLDFVLQAF